MSNKKITVTEIDEAIESLNVTIESCRQTQNFYAMNMAMKAQETLRKTKMCSGIYSIPSGYINDKQWAEMVRIIYEYIPLIAHQLAPAYQELNWRWCGISGDGEIPNHAEINKTFQQLLGILQESTDRCSGCVSTGGLFIEYTVSGEEETVSLKFGMEPHIFASIGKAGISCVNGLGGTVLERGND